VIKTVFLDWGLSLGAGLLFGLAGRSETGAGRRAFSTRSFRWGLVYLHAGVIAISLALYVLNRDWMWMYWVDPRTLPVGIHVVAFALYEVCFLAGFALSSELAPRAAWAIAGVLFAAVSATEVAARTRLFHVGTFEQFRAGAAPPGMTLSPLHVEPEWWVVTIGGGLATLALPFLLLRLHRRGTVAPPRVLADVSTRQAR
jgi:hypothetical protein